MIVVPFLKFVNTSESHLRSHILFFQVPDATLKQTAVVGLKQLVGTILTGYGTLEVTFPLNLSNRPHFGIILTAQLKVRNKERLAVTPLHPRSGLFREREAFEVLCNK